MIIHIMVTFKKKYGIILENSVGSLNVEVLTLNIQRSHECTRLTDEFTLLSQNL